MRTPSPPPLPGAVSFAPSPSCITRCADVSGSDPAMAPAYRTEGTASGGNFPPPLSPRCTGCDGAINAPAQLSASPPGHYTPQLGRASVPTFPGMSSYKFWARRPRICLPCCPSVPPPLLRFHVCFSSVYIVTSLLVPSRTSDRSPVPAVSP